jgi:hypothetical protein
MKKLAILLWLMPFACLAQNIKVTGRVLDSNSEPVPFADALLLNVQDSVMYKSSVTNEQGIFEIKVEKGGYILKIRSLGYIDKVEQIYVDSDTVVPDIVVAESPKTMDDIVINSKRPIIKRKVDRLEFDVENSILSSTNAWEILKKTPGVTASGSGGLTVRGSTSILVTINDKKVYLSGTELKQMLENTTGDDIKSVEVITNPPAKYEAQGNIVLNIKMKKNNLEGYKATISSAYVQSMYPKGVVSTSQHYKGKNLSLSGGYSFGSGIYYREGKDVVFYLDEQGQTASRWESIMNRKNKSLAQNSYRLNAEYEIDSLNIVSIGTNGFISRNSHGFYDVPTTIYNSTGQIDSLYTTKNRRTSPTSTGAYTAGYEHKFSDKAKISFSTDYTSFYDNEKQDIFSEFSLPGSAPYRDTRFVSDNTQDIKLFSAQADYSLAKDSTTVEAGAKFGKVKADNELIYEDDIEGVLVINPLRTSRFLYNEYIYAAYASYSKDMGKWSLKGGLRGEYTSLKGNSVTTAEINKQNYFKLFPTLYALYKPVEGQEVGISYGKRISRPQYSWLNPFRSYYNSYSYFTGDPKLQPAVTHNISLLYTLKSKYNFDFYYRNIKNPSMEISYQDYATSTVVYRFTNIDRKEGYGLDFNTNLQLFSFWEAGMQTGISYTNDSFQGLDGNMYQNDTWNFTGSVNNRFTLNKSKDFTAEVDFFYSSPSVQGTFTISSMSSLSLSLNKKLWEGKGEVALIVSDIYRGEKQRVTTNYANQHNYFDDYSDTQSFRISFKYNIGNQTLKGSSSKEKTEEQERL